jgi:hypothetical protein
MTRTICSAGEATIDVMITIVAMTIDAMTPTGDRDAKGATDMTTNQNTETATVETTAEHDATATDAARRWGRSRGQRARPKADATVAIDATSTTNARSWCIISMRVAPAATKRAPTTVRTRKSRRTTTRGRRPNFAVAMAPPAKRAKTICGSAVAAKETAPARKRKATAPIVPHVPHKDRKDNRRHIASSSESNDGNSDNNEAFLASCDKALGKHDPLDIE